MHIRINIKGLVQGIGFRPFIYRLAKQHQQLGWIANTDSGVTIEIEGETKQQQFFIASMKNSPPPYADIYSIAVETLPVANFKTFDFKNSLSSDKKSSYVLPDISTCSKCVQEMFDPGSRFYRYPFTSCCHCGPRFSIMHTQPYDRSNTSLSEFKLCKACENDYKNPDNRRFHAQTLACKKCGPSVSLLNKNGQLLAEHDNAIQQAVQALSAGKILALKGIGGYQLVVDPQNKEAVALLRKRKHRPRKPFALMLPGLKTAHQLCRINSLEQQALTSAASPIVLLQRQPGSKLMQEVAPGQALLGVMLPNSQLHHLILLDFNAPLIVTSGNCQTEPICISEQQSFNKLKEIADLFLTHNREILRPLDDSIVRLIGNKITPIRRARGYVPTAITLKETLPESLAVGGHLKNTVAVSQGNQAILSQHLGDLDSTCSRKQFVATMTDMHQFYQSRPSRIMNDAHPGYASSQYVNDQPLASSPVQHHYAHILSCMAEHGLQPPLLGIAWDGSGLGSNNKELWGGEFLLITDNGFERYAHLRSFPLPGGEAAIKEPRRAALGLLYELFAESLFKDEDSPSLLAFTTQELNILKTVLNKQINTPRTSSAGRLFDVVASLTGICQINSYEGDASMQLESLANSHCSSLIYPYKIQKRSPLIIDWQQTIEAIISDYRLNQLSDVPSKFHNTLADMMLTIAQLANQHNIVISGGCFQNACLVETVLHRMQSAGFKVFQHEKVPPNDGGLALGQLMATKYI